MDRATVEAYESGAARYVERRQAYEPERARALARHATEGAVRADLGCGPGFYTALLGEPVVALDAAGAMLAEVPERAPHALRVRADLAALPFRGGALGLAWASRSYQHLRHEHLPLALADLHRSTTVGAPLQLDVFAGEGELVTDEDDDFPDRHFSHWRPERLGEVLHGAGFDVEGVDVDGDHLRLRATRARTLPDYVGPGMRVLVCGLNPSLYAADAGVGYARPGNRFWPAALRSGLVERSHDPGYALRHHRLGMTDLVKRASVGADELTHQELVGGVARLERLCAWLRPAVLCVLGLTGWRAGVDRRAIAGLQPVRLGPTAVYLMPNPSGRQAHVGIDGLVAHLRAAIEIADAETGRSEP